MSRRPETLERSIDNGVQEERREDPIAKAREQLEAHNQQRIAGAKQELEALLRKYNISLQTRQMLINGMPAGQVEIAIVPNP